MMMKMIRANWVDLAQGCGVVAGIFLAIHLITAGVLFWGHPDSRWIYKQYTCLS